MITFETGTITEEKFREYLKDILGIRYHKNKKGDLIAYSNFFTITVDIFKKIRKKIKNG